MVSSPYGSTEWQPIHLPAQEILLNPFYLQIRGA